MPFTGFPAQALRFFAELKENNNREWFTAHKEEFEANVKAPMTELVAALNAHLASKAPDYVTEPKSAIYRIYRDTRFSKDKTPYKTHIAALFRNQLLAKHASGSFYAAVSAEHVEVAGGVYMPEPEEMLAIRTLLAERHEEFLALSAGKAFRSALGELQGDQLSRTPKGFASDHPAEGLLRRKQWYWYVTLDPAVATTGKLVKEISRRFDLLLPSVEVLNAPLLARQKAESRRARFAQ